MEVQVEREVVFAEPIEEVWRALTDAGRLAEWFANEVELDPRRGGHGVFRWHDGSVRRAVVEDVEPGRRLRFRWHEEGREDDATIVELEVREADEGTQLTVVESPAAPHASALVGEWSWGIAWLAALPRLRQPAHA